MNSKVNFTATFFLKIIFLSSLFILIFISSISYKNTTSLDNTSDLLVHSYRVQIQLEQLLSYLQDAETGQRGYIITGDSSFLEPYNSALENIKKPFNALKNLTAKNNQQQRNLDSLVKLINYQMELLDNSIEFHSLADRNNNLFGANMIKGKKEMDSIRLQINKMIHLEKLSFDKKQIIYKDQINFTPIFTFALFLFTLSVFIISFIKINNDLGILKTINENLIITTESFRHAEEIGDFGSWQWNLNSNKITYSENLNRMLGIDSQSFKLTMENFIEFVHPNDRHIINEGIDLVLDKKTAFNYSFRIILKDGRLRYFKSVSKVTVIHEKNILIGITFDITEQHLSNLELEQRNVELEQSNKELASFNHIASHDLQEPLRKINTFISLISDKELITLTATGKEYFSKIRQSVDRMRLLINDLLLYSRTNKTDKIFEKTDLNLLLENAHLELLQDIEEKNAVITAAELPVLKVIPFQIQQLFINLIGNSLKYGKPGVSPIIKIDCKKIVANDIPNLQSKQIKKYYKISITDNGLGFEQQFSDKIFTLFYRLHQNSEYPGSGIGLSICKKIVENHNGFITANGMPDIGATFTIFLPE